MEADLLEAHDYLELNAAMGMAAVLLVSHVYMPRTFCMPMSTCRLAF